MIATTSQGGADRLGMMTGCATTTTTVSPGLETQTLLSSIFPLSSVREVGTDKFMMAYCVNLERLSIQAHTTARAVTKERSLMVNNDAMTSRGCCGRDDVIAVDKDERLDGCGEIREGGGGRSVALFGDIGGAEEEYIVEAFLQNSDKIEALIRTLLALEMWRENVLFRRGREKDVKETNEHRERDCVDMVDGRDEDNRIHDVSTSFSSTSLAFHLATNGNTLRSAFILHVETTIVSLLSLIFYRGVPPELLSSKDDSCGGGSTSRGDDVLLALIDYCARQLVFLGTPEEHNPSISRQKNPVPASQLSNHLKRRTRFEEIQDSMHETMYQTAIASASLSRFICESCNELGPSLLSRLLEEHDFPLLMIPLIEEPPWTRRRLITSRNANANSSSGSVESSKESHSTKMVWEKLDDNNDWKEVPPADLLRLTKLEGQPWLAIYHLTTSKVCRESYGLDEYRKAQLMRLRKYIHETLLDQLPVLADVARYLDELCILGVPPSSQGGSAHHSLLLQRVDLIRESIMGKKSIICRNDDEFWETIAQMQWDEVFSHATDSTDVSLRRIASEVYGEIGDMYNSSDIDSTSALDTEKNNSQSIVENCELVDKVVLQIMEENGQVTFELAPINDVVSTPTTIATPMGKFQRIKMSISQTVGECEAIFPYAKIVATVHFQNGALSDRPREVMLSINSLALPTMEHDASQDDYDEVGIELPSHTFTSKEWRQLGNVDTDDVVIQLGFKRLARGMVPAGSSLLRGYSLSQAFVSIRSPSA